MADLYEAIGKLTEVRNVEEEEEYIRDAVLMIEDIIATGVRAFAESRRLNYIELYTTQATIRQKNDKNEDEIAQILSLYSDHPLSSKVIKEALEILKTRYEDLDVIIKILPNLCAIKLT